MYDTEIGAASAAPGEKKEQGGCVHSMKTISNNKKVYSCSITSEPCFLDQVKTITKWDIEGNCIKDLTVVFFCKE